ncbi:MAG: tyrosine--tRNA ligase [Clostridia bacterium]|nr:tyrosine--tRNA ligase [Clostridia bacterium]
MERCKLFEELKERMYLYQMTDEEQIKKLCNGEPITVYCGYDPTADSLHIGHCVSLIMLGKFQKAGHRVIVLLGGATAQIGDPSGRTDMRNMVTKEFIDSNYKKIKETIGRFVKLDGDNPAIIVNNADWMSGYDYINFMRDIGSHFNVNEMLNTEACQSRLQSGGLTFFEMGYQLIQAYDFLRLNRDYGCKLQIGGSDQWGNIIAGTRLGRKMNLLEGKDPEAFQALTCPLLLTSAGTKMGKTANGALWINKDKTSPFEFFQYFYNRDDRDVEMLLIRLTDLEMDEIKKIMSGDIRDAKRTMAYEITKKVHGEQEATDALTKATNMFANNNFDQAPEHKIETLEQTICDILVACKFCASKGEARRMVDQGAISINGNKICNSMQKLTEADFADGFALLKKGKKQFIKIVM